MRRLCGTCQQPIPEGGASWSFTMSIEPPSQNTVASNKGPGRHKYRKFREDYEELLRAFMAKLEIPKARGRRRVFITRLYSARGQKRDRGNIVGGCKPLLDAMTNVGLLVDDKEEFLEDHYDQQRANAKGVWIRIEEIEK